MLNVQKIHNMHRGKGIFGDKLDPFSSLKNVFLNYIANEAKLSVNGKYKRLLLLIENICDY